MEKPRLAQLVAEAIEEQNLSLRSFAKLVGISHPMVSRLLDGEIPSYETCKKLAPVLDLPIDAVLRAAGLLSSIPLDQATLDELKNILSQLPPEKYAEFLEHGWVMVRNARKVQDK